MNTKAIEKKTQTNDAAAWKQPVGTGTYAEGLVRSVKETLIHVSGGKLDAARIERLAVLARMAAQKVPQLLSCSRESFVLAYMDAARTGLDWDGEHAALIPYGAEAKFMPMYKGLIHLAVTSGGVLDVRAVPVFRGERFRFIDGPIPNVEHDVSSFDVDRSDETFLGAWFVARMPDGAMRVTRGLGRKEIEKRRDVSKTKDRKDSPWQLWFTEQGLKTVVKHELKQIPRGYSAEALRLTAAIDVDNRTETGAAALSSEDVALLPPGMGPPAPTNRGLDGLRDKLGMGEPAPEMTDEQREENERAAAERAAAGEA